MTPTPFEWGKGGCSCPSCASTAQFWDKGFAEWPRGNPAGKKSAAAYASHVAYGRNVGAASGFSFEISAEPVFPRHPGLVYPVAPNAAAIAWNSRQKRTPAEAGAVRPAQGSSPAPHFPEGDRPLQTATIIAMPKPKPKQPVGRPPIGKRYLVVLDDESARIARKLGEENLSAGIRAALQAARAPRRARS